MPSTRTSVQYFARPRIFGPNRYAVPIARPSRRWRDLSASPEPSTLNVKPPPETCSASLSRAHRPEPRTRCSSMGRFSRSQRHLSPAADPGRRAEFRLMPVARSIKPGRGRGVAKRFCARRYRRAAADPALIGVSAVSPIRKRTRSKATSNSSATIWLERRLHAHTDIDFAGKNTNIAVCSDAQPSVETARRRIGQFPGQRVRNHGENRRG